MNRCTFAITLGLLLAIGPTRVSAVELSDAERRLAAELATFATGLEVNRGLDLQEWGAEIFDERSSWVARFEVVGADSREQVPPFKKSVLDGIESVLSRWKKLSHTHSELMPFGRATLFRYRNSAAVEVWRRDHVNAHTFEGPLYHGPYSGMVPVLVYATALTDEGRSALGGRHVKRLGRPPTREQWLAKEKGRLPTFIVSPEVLPNHNDINRHAWRPRRK